MSVFNKKPSSVGSDEGVMESQIDRTHSSLERGSVLQAHSWNRLRCAHREPPGGILTRNPHPEADGTRYRDPHSGATVLDLHEVPRRRW